MTIGIQINLYKQGLSKLQTEAELAMQFELMGYPIRAKIHDNRAKSLAHELWIDAVWFWETHNIDIREFIANS